MGLRVAGAAVAGVFGKDDDVCLDAGFAGQRVARHFFVPPGEMDLPLAVFEGDVVLEQEQQHGFCVVGKQHQVDVRVCARSSCDSIPTNVSWATRDSRTSVMSRSISTRDRY